MTHDQIQRHWHWSHGWGNAVRQRWLGLVVGLGLVVVSDAHRLAWGAAAGGRQFLAGAHAMDVTPEQFPVVINGGFFAVRADRASDRLHARCLVLDDGAMRVGLCVVDSCLIPREFADAAKREIQKATGLPPERVMISATHSHTAPSLMAAHGADADAQYPAFLLPRIVEGFRMAISNLAPARVGWAVVPAPEHTHTRVWIRRPDRVEADPFGERRVRANMHPGHENPAAIAPSGPSDPDLSLLAVQALDGRPVAVLANYAMHYHGGVRPVSADYFGRFADQLGVLLQAEAGRGAGGRPFVGIMSQGTSGDQQWMDYGKPAVNLSVDAYAGALARLAHEAYRSIAWKDWASLDMRDRDLPLRTRQPDERRLAWARGVVAAFRGREPRTLPEIYAREQIWLHDNPVRPVKLQALRVGEMGIVMASAEVFAISGLKVKAQSPLRPTFFIELANGEDGYIPPPEHHALGSYNTWACRTACLEEEAETRIVDALVGLLEEVSGKPRRPIHDPDGPYAVAVRASGPLAYWRMNEWDGRRLPLAPGRDREATAEPGVVFYLDGPASPAFSGSNAVNRAFHFAGGRLAAAGRGLGTNYSVELWLWNGLPVTARAVTGHLFSRGAAGAYGAPGEHLSLGGTRAGAGRLVFANGGSDQSDLLVGRTELATKVWHHVVLVREGRRVRVHLNGEARPDLEGEIEPGRMTADDPIFLGGRSDGAAGWEGKLDEIALYGRALTADEVVRHHAAAGMPKLVPASAQAVEPSGGAWASGAAWGALKPLARWLGPAVSGRSVANQVAGGTGTLEAEAEDGVVLPGPATVAATFAGGGRLRAVVPGLGSNYTVAFWFQNELSNGARPVTAYLYSRGADGAEGAPGEHLGLGGTHSHAGRLILFNGNARNGLLAGRTELRPGTWHHVVMVREGRQVRVYLDGRREPDLAGELEVGHPPDVNQIFLGGRSDGFANLQGRMSDVVVLGRALRAEELPPVTKPPGTGEAGTAGGAGSAGSAVRASAEGRGGTAGPVVPPVSAAESLAKIRIRDGYEVELVAAEPLVTSPVAIDWDDRGRLWVVEMVDYPLGMDGKGSPGGRVRVLEDRDADGRYDHAVLFAEGLRFPTGLMTWRGGVLVTAAPEILWLKDGDGDGRAEVREVLYSGFFEGNQQLRVNGLRWGLDNWVYCASGAAWRGYGPGTGLKSHRNGREYAVGSRDFRIRPDTGELDPVSGPSQFGRNRDDWGHWFGVQNSWPIWHYVLEDPYLRRNPHVAAPDPVQQLVRPMNPPVYPVSAREKRFHSFDQAGHFTSACGAMIYQDDLLFGAGGARHAFTCEPFHNVVQHSVLTDDGVTFAARRDAAGSEPDFFASEDRWCRPVMTRTGPDGALWVVDMYRYMIEHPEWLPAEGRAELLPHYRLGEDRGRIYRVYPRGRRPGPIRALAADAAATWVERLSSPNGWVRDQAQMQLLWRNDPSSVPALEATARGSEEPRARLQALWTLEGLGRLADGMVERALADSHSGVRMNALRLAERRSTPAMIEAAVRLVDDPDPKVLLQLASTLGEWRDARAGVALGRLAVRAGTNRFLTAAVLSSAIPHTLALVEATAKADPASRAAWVEPLLEMAVATGQREALALLLRPILGVAGGEGFGVEQMRAFERFLGVLERRKQAWATWQRGVVGEGDELSVLLARVPSLFEAALRGAEDAGRTGSDRLVGASLLLRDQASRETGLRVAAGFLTARTPGEEQRRALRLLGASGDASVPERLAAAWPALGPESRAAALDEWLGREPWAFDLAGRLADGRIASAALDAVRRERLLRHASGRVRQAATRALAAGERSTRATVVEEYRPALALTGEASRGAAVFAKLCASCHRLGGMGRDLGPNLQSVAGHAPEKLLVSILDPNAGIQPGFNAYTARLAGGEELYGLIAAETGSSLVMSLADGTTRTVVRTAIEALEGGNLSLMPEGLEAGLTRQDLADLIRFLREPGTSPTR